MRYLLTLLLIACTAIAQVPNQRVNTLTVTTGLTNNGVHRHVTGAGLGLVFTSDALGNATWQSLAAMNDNLWTNNTSDNSSVVYLKAYPTNFQIRPLWTNGAMLTLGVYTTNWFDAAFGDPKQYYSILSARDVQRGDVDRNNFWFSTSLDTVGSVYGSIDGSTRTNFSLLTVEAVGMPNGGTRRVQAGYDGTATLLSVIGETGSTIITDGNTLVGSSITNLGRYQHTNGAFTGGVFISTNANGDAAWSTNLGNVIISNTTLFSTLISNAFINQAFITNLTTIGGSVGASLWTNDGVVLRPKPTNGEIPNFALRGGVWSNTLHGFETTFNNQTNVGGWSFAWGSNVMARGRGSVAFGSLNLVETNSHYSSILGGSNNFIVSNASWSVIAGGSRHLINFGASKSFIGGGDANNIHSFALESTIVAGRANEVRTNNGTVIGGSGNIIHVNSPYGFLGGGLNNSITGNGEGGSEFSVVVGGVANIAKGDGVFVGGGATNTLITTVTGNDYSTIVGGRNNHIGATGAGGQAHFAFIGGGLDNNVNSGANNSTLGGGMANGIGNSTNSFIGGGFENTITGNGNDGASVIAGGYRNVIGLTNSAGAILGGISNNVVASYAFSIGNQLTNTVYESVDIGVNDFSKTTFMVSSNLFRTNTVFQGPVSFAPRTTAQSLSAGTAITHVQAKVRVVGNGGAVTITAAPTVSDGQDGDWLLILGTDDTNTVTVQDQDSLASSNLHLGAASRLLGNRDTLLLSFDATDSTWHEVAFTNN